MTNPALPLLMQDRRPGALVGEMLLYHGARRYSFGAFTL